MTKDKYSEEISHLSNMADMILNQIDDDQRTLEFATENPLQSDIDAVRAQREHIENIMLMLSTAPKYL